MPLNRPIPHRLLASLAILSLLLPFSLAAQQAGGLEQRIQVLERQTRAMSDLVLRMDTLMREMQQLRGEVEVQSHAMDALKERQRDLYLDLDKRLNDLRNNGGGSSQAPVSNSQPVASAATADTGVAASSISTSGAEGKRVPVVTPDLPLGDPAQEDERYRDAFNLLRDGEYEKAAAALRAFLVQYPDSERADNAQYWLGEAGYVTKQFDQSLADFTTLIEQFPQSGKIGDALLKMGYIQYESKAYDQARALLQRVTSEFANTTAARLAQQQLDRMDREGR